MAQACSDIYTPLEISSTRGVATRLLKISPELSANGLIQCEIVPVVLELEPRLQPQGMLQHQMVTWPKLERLYDGSNELSTPDRIVTATRPKKPQLTYRALSYLWGVQTHLKSILLNGVTHQIGPNLWEFLDCARHETRWCESWWWTDALCIDQDNLVERNYQVQQMGLIYCNAEEVVAWLGIDLEDMDVIFHVAKMVSKSFEDTPHTQRQLQQRPTDTRTVFESIFNTSGMTVEAWKASYHRLMSLEYWRRAWVWQELFLGRRHTMLTASSSASVPDLVHCYNLVKHSLQRVDPSPGYSSPKTDGLTSAIGDWLALVPFDVVSFMYNLDPTSMLRVACSSFHSTLRKDLIYSQLSLLRNGPQFRVDYAEDNLTLFLRVLHFCCMDGPCNTTAILHWEEILRALQIPCEDLCALIKSYELNTLTPGVHKTLLSAFEDDSVLVSVMGTYTLPSQTNDGEPGPVLCPECRRFFPFQHDASLPLFACMGSTNPNAHFQFGHSAAVGQNRIIFTDSAGKTSFWQKSAVSIAKARICLDVSTCLRLVSFNMQFQDRMSNLKSK